MSVSKSSFAYEIPSTLPYLIRKQTLEEKICGIVKKVIAFLNRNQFAITVSFFSFLLSKSIVNSLEDLSIESTTMDQLQNCQDRICAYWNETMHNEKIIGWSKHQLSKLQSRCDASHPHYNPFKSLKRCMNAWCKYANREGATLPECIDPLQKLIDAWNIFCPKAEFNRLRRIRKVPYMNHCIRKFCDYFRKSAEKSTFYFFCSSIEINDSIEKLYNLLKEWKEEHTQKELTNKNLETALSITSSSVGIISAGISVIATIIGCCVAKVTISSFPDVSKGLRNIVDTTLLYARQATTTPPDSMAVAEVDRQISQISSHINSVYHDATSSVSSIEGTNLEELHFNFGYQEAIAEEELSLHRNSLEEIIRAEEILDTERFLESSIFSQGIVQKFIEMTKNSQEFMDSQNSSLLSNNTDLYEITEGTIKMVLRNFTQFIIENATANIDPSQNSTFLDNATLASNITQNFLDYTANYTESSSDTTTTEKPLWKIFLESYARPIG